MARAVSTLVRRARAKLNLRLEIGKPAGHLHTLISVIASLELADIVEFSPSSAGFAVNCAGCEIPERDNLVFRAASELGLPLPQICITIRKHIPLQAGLGGGSSDAASALLGIAQIAVENGEVVSANTLREAAARVGSDVPSALVPGVKIVAGTGETITPYPCQAAPPWGILLLKPSVGSDTARAYALLDEVNATRELDEHAFGRARATCAAFAAANFEELVSLLHNDFSQPIERAMPDVLSARERLERAGARRAILCGSGSCVAGFFETIKAARAAQKLVSPGDGEWCAVTTFHV